MNTPDPGRPTEPPQGRPAGHHGATQAGVRWTTAGGEPWCIECIARVDDDVEDPAEQAERWDAIPDDDGILHARLKEPR